METQPLTHALLNLGKIAYTIPESEIISGLSRARLYRSIRCGELPTVGTGRARRVLRRDLEALVSAQRGETQ
jgi:hypothetical protein